MSNTNIFPKKLSEFLTNVALSTAEDTVTFLTGQDALVLGQGLGSVAVGGLFRTKTVGRKIQMVADLAWAISDVTGALAAKTQVAAGVPYVVELVQETQVFFVMGAAGTPALRMQVVG